MEITSIEIETIDSSNWILLCKKAINEKKVIHLFTIFQDAATQSQKNTNEPESKLYSLLARVFSMNYTFKNSDPFGPWFVDSNRRGFIATDFPEEDLETMKYLIGKSEEHSIDARLADIIWLRKRDRTFAEVAVDNYLKIAENYLLNDSELWNYSYEAFHRCCCLYRQLGRPIIFKTRLEAIVERSIKEDIESNSSYRTRILKLGIEFNLINDKFEVQKLSERLSEEVFDSGNFYKSRDYLQISIDLAQANKDKENHKRLKKNLVDSFVKEIAILKSMNADAIVLANQYSMAIEAARRHGGLRSLIDQLHQEMNEVQEKALTEMTNFEYTVDVTDLVNSAKKVINEAPLEEAVKLIAIMAKPIAVGKIRQTVIDASEEFPLMNTISKVVFNDKGRVVARPNASLSTDEEESEAGIKALMFSECTRQHGLFGESYFDQARMTLRNKAPIDTDIFDDLVTLNPLVPQGREGLYLKGLHAGLNDDFITCAHILIPQIENTIRHYAELSGKLVTKLDANLIQKEMTLNDLLWDKEIEKLLGIDLTFAFKSLLIEEHGFNFRNKLAHGLLSENNFYSGQTVSLWALTIRLLWLGRAMGKAWIKAESKNNSTQSENIESQC